MCVSRCAAAAVSGTCSGRSQSMTRRAFDQTTGTTGTTPPRGGRAVLGGLRVEGGRVAKGEEEGADAGAQARQRTGIEGLAIGAGRLSDRLGRRPLAFAIVLLAGISFYFFYSGAPGWAMPLQRPGRRGAGWPA